MFKDFFVSFPSNFLKVFHSKNIFWHLLAFSLTAVIVFSGFDWTYFLAVRNELLNSVFFPAILIGFFIPLLLPFFIIYFWLRKNKNMLFYSLAVFQTVAIGWIVSALYKALTGRVQPNVQNLNEGISQSFNWNFGFLEHGIFWGWPSSHTTVAFAMMASLIILLQNKFPAFKYFIIIYAFYIGIAVSFQIHWFSEFVAGAIFGSVVGVTVGKYWQHRKAVYEKSL